MFELVNIKINWLKVIMLKLMHKLSVFDGPVVDVAFLSTGKYIAAVGKNNEIIVWSY